MLNVLNVKMEDLMLKIIVLTNVETTMIAKTVFVNRLPRGIDAKVPLVKIMQNVMEVNVLFFLITIQNLVSVQ